MLLLVAVIALAEPGQTALGFPEDAAIADLTAVDVGRRGCVVLGHEWKHIYVHGGPIAVTTNRGRTWAPAGGFQGVVQDVRVLRPGTVAILWEWQIEGVYPGLRVSHDRGRTWAELPLDAAARRTGECCFQEAGGVRVRSADELAVSLDGWGWLTTADGGTTWSDGEPGWTDASVAAGSGRVCRVVRDDDTVAVQVRRGGKWRTAAQTRRATGPYE